MSEWIKECSMCHKDVDGYTCIYNVIYCRSCWPISDYYIQWQKDLRARARPAKALLFMSIIGFIGVVLTVVAKLLR